MSISPWDANQQGNNSSSATTYDSTTIVSSGTVRRSSGSTRQVILHKRVNMLLSYLPCTDMAVSHHTQSAQWSLAWFVKRCSKGGAPTWSDYIACGKKTARAVAVDEHCKIATDTVCTVLITAVQH